MDVVTHCERVGRTPRIRQTLHLNSSATCLQTMSIFVSVSHGRQQPQRTVHLMGKGERVHRSREQIGSFGRHGCRQLQLVVVLLARRMLALDITELAAVTTENGASVSSVAAQEANSSCSLALGVAHTAPERPRETRTSRGTGTAAPSSSFESKREASALSGRSVNMRPNLTDCVSMKKKPRREIRT